MLAAVSYGGEAGMLAAAALGEYVCLQHLPWGTTCACSSTEATLGENVNLAASLLDGCMFQGLPIHQGQQGAGSCITTILPLVLHDVICVSCVASQVCCICAGHLQHHHAHHQQSAGHAACARALYSSRASEQQRLCAGRTVPQHLQHGRGGRALMQTSPSAFIRSSLTS